MLAETRCRLGIVLTVFGVIVVCLMICDVSIPVPRKPPIPGLGRVGVVSIAHDRPEFYRQSLTSILAANRVDEVDLIVSMDDERYYEELERVGNELMFPKSPIVLHNQMPWFLKKISNVDGKITAHHYYIFRRIFEDMGYDYVVLIESDLVVSADIFDFFFKVAPYLNNEGNPNDPICVSGWNDNGYRFFSLNEHRLFRTDYFPGLGWMIHKSTWFKFWRIEWPQGLLGLWTGYDHWLRDDASTRGRDCIVPEVSRTHHVANTGAHVNDESQYMLDKMALASGKVKISQEEVDLVVGSMSKYEARVRRERIEHSIQMKLDEVPEEEVEHGKSITYIIDPLLVPAMNEKYGWFSERLRSSHKGMMTCQFGPKYAFTNITIVLEPFEEYWIH